MILSSTPSAFITMEEQYFELESRKPFAESLIWELNRNFYQDRGISAWSENVVPHQLTSNVLAGKTYAELIVAFLQDLGAQGQTEATVYIVELGAGHGRLAFHVLSELEKLVASLPVVVPPYCYVLTDIVEANLDFFAAHPQFQDYFARGILDYAYFDALVSQEIHLRIADQEIYAQSLTQPILAIANYFFDSLPTDLFRWHNKEMTTCSVALQTTTAANGMNAESLIRHLAVTYSDEPLVHPAYTEPILNEILIDYQELVSDTYLLFPRAGIRCLNHLKNFSTAGLMLLAMDKGFHEIRDLNQRKAPEIITHGSFSLWVNFHALGAFCQKMGGKVLFPAFSNFRVVVGCLLFLPESDQYPRTATAYRRSVDDFGPDDFNTIKKLAYANVARLSLVELVALFRLSGYDADFFIKLLPRLKQVAQSITFNERKRLAQTLHEVWKTYFHINEKYDLAYEIGGLFYDLGFYSAALQQFTHSTNQYGQKADIFYNQVLCYYQLRQDKLFYQTLNVAKLAFPDYAPFERLAGLDMS